MKYNRIMAIIMASLLSAGAFAETEKIENNSEFAANANTESADNTTGKMDMENGVLPIADETYIKHHSNQRKIKKKKYK